MCTLFDKIDNHLNPNTPRIGSRHTYTLQGLVYAFKVWILDTFPNNSIDNSPMSGVIPQVVAYLRLRRLHVPDCQRILDVTNVYSLVHHIIYKLK
uniref:Uncharacterized protein n=1 Tax=Lactuca sativa TaxID=4236 RepID=A0A9R1W959_LACSA|nr:hypothetical protein LSAT_V11C300133420 [Lactuca sativa]